MQAWFILLADERGDEGCAGKMVRSKRQFTNAHKSAVWLVV